MTLYAYYCPGCEKTFENRRSMGQAPPMATCRYCGRTARRVFEMPTVHYKARGFTGAGRAGDGRVDHFRHADGSPLTDADKNRVPAHVEEEG